MLLSPRQFVWTTLALLASLIPHGFWMPVAQTSLALGLLLVRFFQRRLRPGPWPGPLKILLLLLLTIATFSNFHTLIGRAPGMGFLMCMLALKSAECENRRDARWLVTASLFVVAAAFLFNQSFLLVGYMLLAIVVIFAALQVLHSNDDAASDVSQLLNLGRLREIAILLALSAPLTICLWLFFPRLASPMWGTPTSGQATTGLGPEMRPGTISALLEDDRIAFRAQFNSNPPPAKENIYWRGPVLWNYDGEAWTTSWRWTNTFRKTKIVAPSTVQYDVTLEPTNQNYLVAMDYPVSVSETHGLSQDGQIRISKPVGSLLRYSAISTLTFPGASEFPVTELQAALELPAGFNPRMSNLGAALAQEFGHDSALLANHILAEIRTKDFYYTLTPPLLGTSAMDEFWFDTRRGFCEHYASAFVVLMRSAGVPSRVVTGFLGGRWNEIGQHFTVLYSDAHAWAEYWNIDHWQRIDPTGAVAPQRIESNLGAGMSRNRDSLQNSWIRNWQSRFDAVGAWWNNTILGFNATRQSNLLAPLGLANADWRQLTMVMVATGATAGFFALLVLFLRHRRAPRDPVLQLYLRWCKQIAKRGVIRQGNEGPQAFASRAKLALPNYADAIGEVTTEFVALTYANRTEAGSMKLAKAIDQMKTSSRNAN
jgi:protein-glutamine gamma-glutamyltransferase